MIINKKNSAASNLAFFDLFIIYYLFFYDFADSKSLDRKSATFFHLFRNSFFEKKCGKKIPGFFLKFLKLGKNKYETFGAWGHPKGGRLALPPQRIGYSKEWRPQEGA